MPSSPPATGAVEAGSTRSQRWRPGPSSGPSGRGWAAEWPSGAGSSPGTRTRTAHCRTSSASRWATACVLRTKGTWLGRRRRTAHGPPATRPAEAEMSSASLKACADMAPPSMSSPNRVATRCRRSSTPGPGRGDRVSRKSPRHPKQARPDVGCRRHEPRAGQPGDHRRRARERLPYRFTASRVGSRRALARRGLLAVGQDGSVVATVERKSLPDLASSLTNGGSATPWPRCRRRHEPRWWSRTAGPRCSS